MTKMDLRDGRTERNDRSGNKTPTALFGYKRIRSYAYDRIYSGICRSEARQSNTPCERKRNSSIQNIQPSEQNRKPSWHGSSYNPISNNKKCTTIVYFILDNYTNLVYINHHNYPTKNKKARLAPGSEVNLRLTPKRFLSPLLFAVNQKF